MEGIVDPSTAPDLGNVFLGHLLTILEEYYRRRFGDRFTRFGDKLPDYCAVAMAAKWSPDVRILLMVRDPRDVVCSYRAVRHRSAKPGPREDKLLGYSVRDFAIIWRDTNEHILREAPGAWRVPYELLVRNPVEAAEGVLRHLGLAYEPGIDRAIASNDTLATHGSSRTAEDSIGRWRRDLDPAHAAIVTEICGSTMESLGLPV
jgi:hypothetical protein